jgi:RNA polymerase sigma factor (sigma-70 family)
MPSDSELLQSYARDRDEAAFAELVRSHIDLVYTAAARRVGGDPHGAAEITQEVFLSLARHAGRLAKHPVLNAWLHTSTRNAAANFLRGERRRAQHHQEAHAMQESDAPDSLAHAWTAIRPELDAALDELAEPDRQAIVLRFFENQSYPVLGARLGLREEAARMRVGRALEKLRGLLARRGIASTSALLGGALSAHGVAGAPAGLAAAVGASVAAASVATPAFGFLYLMSTTKVVVTLASAAVIAGVSLVVYRNHIGSSAATDTAVVVVPPAPRSTPKPIPPAPAPEPTTPPISPASVPQAAPPSVKVSEGAAKVAVLREILERLPDQNIPELKLATEADWYAAVDEAPLESPEDIRRALGSLRSAAERRFARLVQPALRAYIEANGGQFPADPLQLQALVDPKIELVMLGRYRVAAASEIPNVGVGSKVILTQKSLIDSDYDSRLVIGPNGSGSSSASAKVAGARGSSGGGGGGGASR